RGRVERSAAPELGRRGARLGPVLECVLEAGGEARAAAADEGRGAAGLLAARAARREAEARASTLRSGVDAAERCVRAAREAAEERPAAALIEVRSRWVERRSALETLVEVADRAGMADAAERRHREAAREHGDRREAAQTRAAQAGAARAELAARLEEAETLRDRVRATIDLSARRAELVVGEPCPLCGASEHPYRHEAPALAELDRAQRTRLAELRDEAAALDGARASARTEAGAEARAAAAATDEAERWAARLGEARARWKETAALVGTEGEAWPEELPARSASPRAPEGGAPDWGPLFRLVEVTPSPAEGQPDAMLDPGAREGLARATREAVERIGEIEAEEQRRRAREGAAAEARDALEEARRELAAAEAALHRAREEQSRAEAARDGAHERGRRAEAAVTRGLGVLDPVLASVPGWRERWTVEPERCAASVARAAEAWRQLDEQRTQALERARAVEPRVAAAQAALDRARAEEGRLRGERQAHEDRAQELAEARAAHWGGRPVREGAEELAARVEGARAAREAALGRAAEARASVGEARALAAHRGEARAAASTGRAEADAALEAALAAVGLEEAEVRRRLAHEGTHLETWRQELEALDRRRRDAVAVLQERRRRREAHEAGEGPDGMPRPRVGAADAAGALAEARRRVDEARARWTEARSDLARDDADRARRGHVARDVARQKGDLAVWESLADLIGSANGGKLRVFAQSVTLELLLDHANHHLRDLAPRYRLERVPGEDLALQVVDREMGDEARAVQSLSGGESFLVALGMALGLASLSSDRAHVESLFIDEGFGTLDPASLEVVLATLDTLRSTGRQVGVISHVQTVAERFGTRVEVVAAGPARSRVELVEGP
ncbi:MAG: SbcC/MukB-like Walker B domain-containing protein, partial [Sandaracinaceae bacterium]